MIAAGIYAVCAAEFVIDVTVDQRIAFGIFYLPMVGTAVFYRDPRAVWKLAGIASLMVTAGFFLPVINESMVEAAINRVASVVAIFVTAGLLHYGRRAQERLAEQTLRAERADRAKARLLTNLSREILTPLNSIVGFSELLQDGCRPDQREYLGHIQIAGKRLLSTFLNLIDLSHSDERRLQSLPIGVVASLEEAIKATHVQAAERRVALDLAFGDTSWPDVKADPWAVKRILENLLSNAIKYSNHGETVFVAVTGNEHQVSITIRDCGIGMSTDVLRRLGETFYQADPVGARRFEGLGAGIALSLQLAAAMGGELRFDSNPDQGTLATLVLPVAKGLTIHVDKMLKLAT